MYRLKRGLIGAGLGLALAGILVAMTFAILAVLTLALSFTEYIGFVYPVSHLVAFILGYSFLFGVFGFVYGSVDNE